MRIIGWVLLLGIVFTLVQVVVGEQGKIIIQHYDPSFAYESTTFVQDGRYVAFSAINRAPLHNPRKIHLFDLLQNTSSQVWNSSLIPHSTTVQLSNTPYFAITYQLHSDSYNTTLEIHSLLSKPSSLLPLWSRTLSKHIGSTAISKNGRILATTLSHRDFTIEARWFDVKSGSLLGFWIAPAPILYEMAGGGRLSDNATVLSFYCNTWVVALNISSSFAQPILTFNTSGPIYTMKMSPSGRTIITVSNYHHVQLYRYSETQNKFELGWKTVIPDQFPVETCAVTDTHAVVAGIGNSGQALISLFSVEQPTPVWEYYSKKIPVDYPNDIIFSGDGRMIAAALAGAAYESEGNNPELTVFSVEKGLVWNYTTEGSMFSVDLVSQPNGGYLLAGCGAHGINYGSTGGDLYVAQLK
eukprot:TRINITY_DN4939_c0_g1_i1.p1 TRINITY_DN4939_c0_g1~~TRINITY_DN4939_c0_g1_i1.p1  ORF type:complete len:412 (+),score=59.20 TRINITY_DN4939_c0_g1_i1:89-1324(+)